MCFVVLAIVLVVNLGGKKEEKNKHVTIILYIYTKLFWMDLVERFSLYSDQYHIFEYNM